MRVHPTRALPHWGIQSSRVCRSLLLTVHQDFFPIAAPRASSKENGARNCALLTAVATFSFLSLLSPSLFTANFARRSIVRKSEEEREGRKEGEETVGRKDENERGARSEGTEFRMGAWTRAHTQCSKHVCSAVKRTHRRAELRGHHFLLFMLRPLSHMSNEQKMQEVTLSQCSPLFYNFDAVPCVVAAVGACFFFLPLACHRLEMKCPLERETLSSRSDRMRRVATYHLVKSNSFMG